MPDVAAASAAASLATVAAAAAAVARFSASTVCGSQRASDE